MSVSLDLSSLSAAYAAGTLTPRAVVEEVYRRIAEMGEKPVWISLVPKEQALARAAAATGPLAGIPFAVKDNIDVKGIPTTCACPEFAYTPERSATIVERLEAAGAILIGKTNLDQFATGLVGTRTPYGICSSVFDAAYVSGGSSAGSGVAVAGGLVSFALGTDTAGSGRVPAAFNNIVGLKPTKGLFSTRGLVPACRTQDVISIFALTSGDAAKVAEVAAAYDAEDPYSRKAPKPYVASAPAALRIGVPKSGLEFFGDAEAEKLYWAAVENAKALGTVVEFDFAPFAEAASLLYSGPWVAERFAAIRAFAESTPEAIIEPVRSIIFGAKGLSAADAFQGFYKLADFVRAADAEWARMDAMLLPTTGTTYKIADVLANPVQLNSNLGRYTNFVNLMDLAAFAVPAGFRSNGLPFGVTLIGPAFSDGALAALGDRLHRSLPALKLGATTMSLAGTPPLTPANDTQTTIEVAVVGAHLTGQPLNWQLTDRNGKLLETTRTAPGYRLYALPGTTPPKPGLVFDGTGPGLIEVEIWEMEQIAFGSFVALIPAPLGIGTLKLEDGRSVKGFLAESYATAGGLDISSFGGWRAWLAQK
jgi:allophanate hydrolase